MFDNIFVYYFEENNIESWIHYMIKFTIIKNTHININLHKRMITFIGITILSENSDSVPIMLVLPGRYAI